MSYATLEDLKEAGFIKVIDPTIKFTKDMYFLGDGILEVIGGLEGCCVSFLDTYESVYYLPEITTFEKEAGEMLAKELTDVINNPTHYKVLDDIEAIDIIQKSLTPSEFKGYCLGNILKYRIRAGNKDDAQQDIDKANKYVELYEKYTGSIQSTDKEG